MQEPNLLSDDALSSAFYRILAENARRLRQKPPPREWLQVQARALQDNLFAVLAYLQDGTVGAVASFVFMDDSVTCMLNGSTEQGRHDFATNRALWEGILESQRRGCRWFDFDGMYDERYPATEVWQGFGRFKQGFGGDEVTFMGSYIKSWPFLRARPRQG